MTSCALGKSLDMRSNKFRVVVGAVLKTCRGGVFSGFIRPLL